MAWSAGHTPRLATADTADTGHRVAHGPSDRRGSSTPSSTRPPSTACSSVSTITGSPGKTSRPRSPASPYQRSRMCRHCASRTRARAALHTAIYFVEADSRRVALTTRSPRRQTRLPPPTCSGPSAHLRCRSPHIGRQDVPRSLRIGWIPQALLALTERGRLRLAIGDTAERYVYRYASCDRAFTYPGSAPTSSSSETASQQRPPSYRARTFAPSLRSRRPTSSTSPGMHTCHQTPAPTYVTPSNPSTTS